MRTAFLLLLLCGVGMAVSRGHGQDLILPEAQPSEMTRRLPAVGLGLTDDPLFDSDGRPVPRAAFRDQYTVLVFGCLT